MSGLVKSTGVSSGLVGSVLGITEADSWRISANYETGGNGSQPVTANWERDDVGQASKLVGTGMTESSGIFTFPSTGLWWIIACGYVGSGTTSAYAGWNIQCTTDGSSYSYYAEHYCNTENAGEHAGAVSMTYFNVPNVSTHKCRVVSNSTTHGFIWHGNTAGNKSGVMFLKLGDI